VTPVVNTPTPEPVRPVTGNDDSQATLIGARPACGTWNGLGVMPNAEPQAMWARGERPAPGTGPERGMTAGEET
jgi:hypothetical protein